MQTPKRQLFTIVMGLCVVAQLVVYSVQAQRVTPELYFSGGLSFPVSSDAAPWATGSNFSAGGGLLIGRFVSLNCGVEASRLPFRSIWRPDGVTGGTVSTTAITAGIELFARPRIMRPSPRLSIRFGHYRERVRDAIYVSYGVPYFKGYEVEGSSLGIGLGADLRLSYRLSVFGQLRYCIGKPDGRDDLTQMPLNLGLRCWPWGGN